MHRVDRRVLRVGKLVVPAGKRVLRVGKRVLRILRVSQTSTQNHQASFPSTKRGFATFEKRAAL